MLLSRHLSGAIVEENGHAWLLRDADWSSLLLDDELPSRLLARAQSDGESCQVPPSHELLAPIGRHEVWAAGVTYYRSRDARMEESQTAGGADFYARVYEAQRPELFFKATHYRVIDPHKPLRIRSDSRWNVPEPELTLVTTPSGRIIGYTVGNDMSSRDIEGENPLYLPQAKVYTGSCSIGPKILLTDQTPGPDTKIELTIRRDDSVVFQGSTTLAQLKRKPGELVEYLYRDNDFPYGAMLLTGTGIVPDNNVSVEPGDIIQIAIDGIGVLENPVG